MTSEARNAANQANALQSTGPRTPAGKARVSQNAVKHGLRGQFHLIAGEEPAEFNKFCRLLDDQIKPSGALEEALAELVVTALWRLRRIRRMEGEMIDQIQEDRLHRKQRLRGCASRSGDRLTPNMPVTISLGEAIKEQIEDSDVMGNLYRYEAHIERGLYKALHELQRLQAVRQGQVVPAPLVVEVVGESGPDK